jgi:hypothetical protein
MTCRECGWRQRSEPGGGTSGLERELAGQFGAGRRGLGAAVGGQGLAPRPAALVLAGRAAVVEVRRPNSIPQSEQGTGAGMPKWVPEP